jgi:hypothetical protein
MRTLGRALTKIVLMAAMAVAITGSPAQGAVSCPNANPVLNENNCQGAGTSAWRMVKYSDDIGGFATKTSVNLGQDVALKIGRNAPLFPATSVDVSVYRMGSYGGLGGRLIPAASKLNVPVNNTQTCNPADATTGRLNCSNWGVTYTIPGASLPASGVYLVRLRTTDTGIENQVIFTVRDDARASKVLFVLPIASYEAYNNWGGKSLYFDKYGGPATVSGSDRAVKVSFDRPFDNAESTRNRFNGPDSAMVSWLEKEGYDVTYTDDVQASIDAASLKQHKIVLINGHSEYWSLEQFNNVKAARDAGVSLASFSSNTAYWKIRYEDGHRTIVCYKTVEGNGSSGTVGANDWGPDGIKNTSDDALGADGLAGTADDNPQNATTTFRDKGAPPGDPNAPAAGRVGPNMPENQLWGNMYFGDNEAINFPLKVPAANAAGEFSGDRVWRNAGLPTNANSSIGTDLVGWEWDQVPTQAQYLAKQPANVKRVTATDVTDPQSTWLQDEGRMRAATPAPGQPSTVSAVRYTAPSGARVFAAGTNQWASGLDDPRISQATYNILSDMLVAPATPSAELTLDSTGTPPNASFTLSPNPARTAATVTFDGSASTAAAGATITHFQWDLDGDGTYERDTGTTSTVTGTFATEGSYDVHLKVTDSHAATDIATRTITIINNQPPTAAVSAAPNPAVATQDVTLDGSASSDPDGHIARYQWDLDGNGTYETDGGAASTLVHAFNAAGTYQVGLKVTDDGNPAKSATATVPVTINSGGLSNYGDAVLRTPGLLSYWRMGETTGPTLADSAASTPATVTGGTFGVAGGPPADPNTAVRFNGLSDWGKTALDLSGTQKVTVEFWLNWSTYANNDQLAMEFTPNFNNGDGGFLVDPNAPQFGGTFGVGLGRNGGRNNVFFARPSAGVWHHYAIVMDTTAASANVITPYVDGQPVAYQKADSGTGAGPFANSTLYLMSRGGSALLGGGSLDELAVYTRALGATAISTHAQSYGTNRQPIAAFTATPNPVKANQTLTLDASASRDPDGIIKKYQWDLDGNGTYETTSLTPTLTTSYPTDRTIDIGLRVIDDGFAQDTISHSVIIGTAPPIASFTATPNPAPVGQAVKFDASASHDPDGTIASYSWDLDGNGTYETPGGATATITHAFTATGTVTVGLRVTDDTGATGTTTLPVTINAGGRSNYANAVLRTPGLRNFWRLGEASGTTALADSAGTATATPSNVTLGVTGAPPADPNTAARFGGNASATAGVDLSNTSVTTVEFWLKWSHYANDDALAMELTPNFNGTDGGILVDPNAPQFGGTFGVALGRNNSRNNVFFARPSAGVWHHYAFVLDPTAPAAGAITPYVDGQPIVYQKADSGTGAGPFAKATLYMMSRGGSSLFGSGDLDEVALYGRALTATEVLDHAESWGTNTRPVASFSTSPATPRTGQTVTLDGSGSHDSDGTIVRYQWDLDGDGTYETDTGTNPIATRSYAVSGTFGVGLKVTDNGTAFDTQRHSLTIANSGPVARLTATPSTALIGDTVTLDASGSDAPVGPITHVAWDLDGNGTYETDGGTTLTRTTTFATAGSATVGVQITDGASATATATASVTVKATSYAGAVLATPGLRHLWRMDDPAGSTTLADGKGTQPATFVPGTLGVPGALGGSGTAARFGGAGQYAKADLNLSDTSTLTIEFWMKWDQFLGNDALAMEFTPNFNDTSGGFLVDPNAGFAFGVALGRGPSRNNAYFSWPSAQVWHHYAFVLDATATGATQVKPYVDGNPVSYFKFDSGTGAGPFANSTLYFMSRAGAALFGPGVLDEVAVYDTALPASTIAEHYAAGTP